MAAFRRLLLALVVLGFAQSLPTPALAALLGSYSKSLGATTFEHTASSADLDLCLDPSSSCGGTVLLFDSLAVSTADAGTTYAATSTTDPGFDAFAAGLTDGSDETLFFVLNLLGGGSFYYSLPESLAFAGSSSLNGIDFAGFAIDRIELQLGADFAITPLVGAVGTTVQGALTMRVFGSQVPEPTTAVLMSGGLLGIASRRRFARCGR